LSPPPKKNLADNEVGAVVVVVNHPVGAVGHRTGADLISDGIVDIETLDVHLDMRCSEGLTASQPVQICLALAGGRIEVTHRNKSIISIVIWALSRFGPGDSIEQAGVSATAEAQRHGLDSTATTWLEQQYRLEASGPGWQAKP